MLVAGLSQQIKNKSLKIFSRCVVRCVPKITAILMPITGIKVKKKNKKDLKEIVLKHFFFNATNFSRIYKALTELQFIPFKKYSFC